MRTDDLPADIAAFRRAGVEIEVSAGERLRPDGYRLRWTLAQPTAPHSFVVPFLIEDMTPREERVPRDHRHRNGVSGVAVLTVVVRDLALARGCWSLAEPQSVENVHRPELAAGGIGFAVGAQRFEFLAPNAGASPLSAWLAQRGAGPWSIALRTSREPVTLDERKARSRVMLAH
jgi:hypothetical protein